MCLTYGRSAAFLYGQKTGRENMNSKLRIMIVDDELIVREDIRTIMDWGKYDYEITGEASNGRQACDLFRKQPVDIIIADIEMPVMDGLTMAAEILKQDQKVKFIFLTAYSDFYFLRTSIQLGIHSYILKHELEEEVLLKELDSLRREIQLDGSEETDMPWYSGGEDRFSSIRSYIDHHYEEDLSLEELAKEFQITESYLSHQFKVTMGISIKSYLKKVRMEKARELILSGRYKIGAAARKVGYHSIQYFYLVFKQYYGVTPAEMVKGDLETDE